MVSSVAPRWKVFLIRWAPFLFKQCPAGNYHWTWHEVCYCRVNEHVVGEGPGTWNGGIMLFNAKKGQEEYVSFWSYARVLADWLTADDLIQAQGAYKEHELVCPTCWTDSRCNQGEILYAEIEKAGQKYYALIQKRTEPRRRP